MRGILEIKPKGRDFNILVDYAYIKNVDEVMKLNIEVGNKLILNNIDYEVTLVLKCPTAFYLDVREI